MRFLISFTFVFLFAIRCVAAEPWQCGTPLLIADTYNTPQRNSGFQTPPATPAAPAAPIQLGDMDSFFIHIPEMEVKATCVAISEHLYVYVENSVRALFSDAEAGSIAAEFDARIYPKVRQWMGTEWKPGIDRDNRITLLMHDVGMNASGRDYGGYFSPVDQHTTAPNSNRREMLFMDVYQFRERPRHTFYSSLAHEFAHLINWFQNGGTTDQRWLEEGIASFVEWAVYGTVHTVFVDSYLTTPNISLPYTNTGDVYYGAAFMLLLYLYEQYGGAALIRGIVEQDSLGEQAIDNALASVAGRSDLRIATPRFPQVFLNWGLANWVNNTARGKQLGYQHLQNRKVNAAVQRVNTYPSSADNIPIQNWGTHYILFQNLPETLDISVAGNATKGFGLGIDQNPSYIYATTLYLSPNAPVGAISESRMLTFDTQNTGHVRREGLQRGGQIVLMVTADAPQLLHYTAVDTRTAFVDSTPRQPKALQAVPNTITYTLSNRTQPSQKKSNISYRLEPMTQLHLSSDYLDVVIHGEETGTPYLYAASDWGLEIFTLAQPTKPVRIGEIATPGRAQAVAVDSDTAYVADGDAGVHLIHISQPTAPRIVKTLSQLTYARSVRIDEGDVYVLDSEQGLLVFDLQNLHNAPTPQFRRFFRTAGTPLNLSIKDDTIYLSDDRQGLYILNPSPFGNFVLRGIAPILAVAHEISNAADTSYAYVAGGNLRIVDVTDALQPQTISSLDTPGLATGIQAHNSTVYLTDRQAGLHIIDVRNPQQPQRITTQPTFGNAVDIALWIPQRVTNHGASPLQLIYIADGKGGIQTIDIHSPESPKWLNRYASSGIAHGLDIVEREDGTRTVYVANGTGGLKTLELTTPYEGTLTQTLPLPDSATRIRVQDGHGFVATQAGMFIVNMSANALVAQIPTVSPVSDIALFEGYAYLCAESLIVVDSQVPQQSRIVSRRNMRGSAYRIALDTSHAYVAALEGGMHIFDITEPATPRPIANYASQGNATCVALAAERAYLLDSRVGVTVLDISEPTKPIRLGEYANDALPIDAQIRGNYLYLLDSESLQLIDSRTLTAISRFNQLRFPFEFQLTDTALYIADLYQLRIFQVHPHRFSLAVEGASESDWTPTVATSRSLNSLGQNFPNPFNPETWIPYQLASSVNVTLSIYDAQGRRVYFEPVGFQSPGTHMAYWDGRNKTGEPVASGIYFYSLEAGNFRATRKMLIRR